MILQAAILYSSVRPETKVPASRPLSEFPTVLGPWTQFGPDGGGGEETRTVLNADDLLDRNYVNSATRRGAFFFVAAFRTQRNGKAPHSPKNCLPGSGWTQESSDLLSIEVGNPQPITVNRYVVQHGEERSLVMYWYQSRQRVVAS